uniref:Uncharacterized protein n=1 Tax=Oryza rufipogon TaxID=4529 RepID=A0A0E0NWN0_ORYRU
MRFQLIDAQLVAGGHILYRPRYVGARRRRSRPPSSTPHAGARRRRPHPPSSTPRQSSSPAAASFVIHVPRWSSSPTAASFVIHVPRRSSSPTATSYTVHAMSDLVGGGCVLRRLDKLAKYMPVVLRADDGGEGSTFALYFLICRHVRARLLLPCVGASEEFAVAGQCVDGASVGAAAGTAGEELVVVGQCIDGAGVGAAVPRSCQPCTRAGAATCPAETVVAARDVHGQVSLLFK